MNPIPRFTDGFSLLRDAFGKLVLVTDQGERHVGVQAVRAFPIQAPEEGISLITTAGKEAAWIDRRADLALATQDLLRENLLQREFMPVVRRITAVTSYSTPCTWSVETDKGPTQFVLKGDEDIRRVGKEHALMIADVHGIHYFLPDQFALDAQSKKILDRFM